MMMVVAVEVHQIHAVIAVGAGRVTVTVTVVVLLSVSGNYNRFGHRYLTYFRDFLGLLAEVFGFVRISVNDEK